jgi:hypothetical protein
VIQRERPGARGRRSVSGARVARGERRCAGLDACARAARVSVQWGPVAAVVNCCLLWYLGTSLAPLWAVYARPPRAVVCLLVSVALPCVGPRGVRNSELSCWLLTPNSTANSA